MEPSIEVKELIDHKNSIYKEIYARSKSIKSLKVKLAIRIKKIFSTCNHNWVRDWDAPFDSHCKRICSICKLYANPHYNA